VPRQKPAVPLDKADSVSLPRQDLFVVSLPRQDISAVSLPRLEGVAPLGSRAVLPEHVDHPRLLPIACLDLVGSAHRDLRGCVSAPPSPPTRGIVRLQMGL
jgi:hypothetical protein